MKVEGLEGIKRSLSELDAKVQKKVTRHALRAAAKPIQAEARRQAKQFDRPETPDRVWKQITTRSLPKRAVKASGGDLGVAIGVKDSKPGETFHYAKFVLLGTSQIQANPVLRRSADTKQTDALNAFADDLWDGIRKQTS